MRTETEPYDESLDRRIWSLADQRMKWQLEIANKRRTLPTEVGKFMEELLDLQRSVDAETSVVDESIDADTDFDVHQDGSYPIAAYLSSFR
jgi:hypothetical protein